MAYCSVTECCWAILRPSRKQRSSTAMTQPACTRPVTKRKLQMSYNQMMNEVMQDTPHLPEATDSVVTQLLTEDDCVEVIAFLAERPIHTVAMAGLIRDNGIVSEDNRGSFWGCRNSEGRLEGVALIGHATLIEARS